MPDPAPDQDLQDLCARIQHCIAPFAGRVEYGNLRIRISEWDCDEGEPVTNIALVYETPGGSTDQINVSYYHDAHDFGVIDEHQGELRTPSTDAVMEQIQPRISGIPQKRIVSLHEEIRRQIDGGTNTTGLVVHINRMMQGSLLGGTITHVELREAMTYAMQYMKARTAGGTAA
jgi:hypothetical protein